MTTTGLFATAEIRARLDAGYPDWEDVDSDNWDWDNTLDDILNHNKIPGADESAVRAFLQYLDVSSRSGEKFTPSEFADELKDRYRNYWSSAAKFAREHAAPEWADMGDQPTGRREALEQFGDVIDWDAYAERTEFTDEWAVITLPGESGVYVFEE